MIAQARVPSQGSARGAAEADVAVWRRIVDTVEANAEYPWPPAIDPKRFAEIIGVGRHVPTSLDLALIADNYQVTVAWLLTGDDHGLDDGVISDLQEYICQLTEQARTAEERLGVKVEATHRVWQIVGDLRRAALADGRGLYSDPVAQRLSAALTGMPDPAVAMTEAASKESK